MEQGNFISNIFFTLTVTFARRLPNLVAGLQFCGPRTTSTIFRRIAMNKQALTACTLSATVGLALAML
ncbi:MAG: hypothetical protein ACREWJ_10720, partial [Rhodoferax sp.]